MDARTGSTASKRVDPQSVEEGLPALPSAAKQQPGWRPSRALLLFLTSGLVSVAVLSAVVASSIRDSVPSVRPVRVALDASSQVESLTALVEAEVEDSPGTHTVRLKGGFCVVEADCELGVRCTVATVQINEPVYPEASRMHFTALAAQTWPQNLRKAFSSRGRTLSAACDLEAEVDLFKIGWVFGRTSRWHFEDLGAFAQNTVAGEKRSALRIRHQTWGVGKQPKAGKNVSAHADFVAEWTLPIGPLVHALEAVSVGVKADVAYAETTNRALESHLHMNADLSVVQNTTTGRAVVSLPFRLEGRADLPSLGKFLPMAALKLAPSTDLGNFRVSKSDHALDFEATSDGRAAAQLLGQAHTLGWRRETIMSQMVSDSRPPRALALAGNSTGEVTSHARRLIDILGIKEFATHHRIYMDDGESVMIGADVMWTEGPPFKFKLGAVLNDVIEEDMGLVANITFMFDEVKEKGQIDVSLAQSENDTDTSLVSFTMKQDSKAETFDVGFSLDFEEEEENTNVGLEFGVKAKDALVTLTGNLNEDFEVSLSGDFDDLIFNATVNIEDMIHVEFHGKEDQVDLDADLHEIINEAMHVKLEYRRTDEGEDLENFEVFLMMEEVDSLLDTKWYVPWNASDPKAAAVMTAGAHINVDHGRRRTSAAGGTMVMTGGAMVMGECFGEGDALNSSDVTCVSTDGENISCCEETLQYAVMDMVGLEMGKNLSSETMNMTVDSIAGTEEDFDLGGFWDASDPDMPHASAMYRVVDGVHTLTVLANVTTMVTAITQWEEIDGGYKAEVSMFDEDGDLNITAGGELAEVKDNKKITWSGGGSVSDKEGLIGGQGFEMVELLDGSGYTSQWTQYNKTSEVASGSYALTDTGITVLQVQDGETLVDSVVYFEEKSSGNIDFNARLTMEDSELAKAVAAYDAGTGKWTSELHADSESLGKLDFMLDEKSSGDLDFDMTFVSDGTKLVDVDLGWVASSGWGGDLSVSAAVDLDGTMEFGLTATASEAEEVQTIDATLKMDKEVLGMVEISGYEGSADAPLTFSGKFKDETGKEMGALSVEASPLDGLQTNKDRVIVLTKPIKGSATFTMAAEDEGDDATEALVSWNVDQKEKDSGNLVAAGLALDVNKESLVALDASFDTSSGKSIVVSADLNSGDEPVATVRGSLPFDGDYMAGDLEVNVEDHTQVIETRISRGFLLEEETKHGIYDRMWFNFETTIGADETEMKVDMDNLYFERGPLLAWSGTGWMFRLSELDGKTAKDIYYHSFGLGFDGFTPPTKPPPPPTMPPVEIDEETGTASVSLAMGTDVEAVQEMTVDDVMEFVSASSGMDMEEVAVEDLSFEIKAVYAFDASVTVDQATSAVAVANGVEESQVTLIPKSRRRLSHAAPARRLAAVEYDTLITVPDLEKAKTVMASAADEDLLVEALAEVDPTLPPPVVAEVPAIEVKIVVPTTTTTDAPDATTTTVPECTTNCSNRGAASGAPRLAAPTAASNLAASLACAVVLAAALPGARVAP